MESTHCDIGSSCAREVSIATCSTAKQRDHIDSVNVQREINLLSSAYTDRLVALATRRSSSTHTYRAHDWHILRRPGTKMADLGLADTAQLGPAGLPAEGSRDLEDLGFCCFGTPKSRAVRHCRTVARRDIFELIDSATMHMLRASSIFVGERLAENQQHQHDREHSSPISPTTHRDETQHGSCETQRAYGTCQRYFNRNRNTIYTLYTYVYIYLYFYVILRLEDAITARGVSDLFL